MAGVTGKGSLSYKKLDVSQSKVPALGFKKTVFAHKATALQTVISLTGLTTPTEMTANGFVQPGLAELTSSDIRQFKENLTLKSSLRGDLHQFLSYIVTGATTIKLLFNAEEGEIFTGVFDANPRTFTSAADAIPLVVTGTLLAGTTDFNVGTAFRAGAYIGMQHGEVMVLANGVLMYRNTGNNPPGVGVTGDYYEVPAGGGLAVIVRFNEANPVLDRNISVLSVGSLIQAPNGSEVAMIESVQGQIDAMVPTLAALAGVAESVFQAAPNNVNLKAFGDSVLANTTAITTKQGLLEPVFLKDVKANATNGGTFTSGSFLTRTLNTIENPFGVSWIALAANQFTLQPGTYLIEGGAPAFGVDNHKTKIRNITDSTDAIIGSSAVAGSVDTSDSHSLLTGTIVVATAKVFELQHYANTTKATSGFGSNTSSGINEVYSQLKITRIR